ncbi:uncharacterized protein JCM10292_007177 [Rhodotorula paludigena]|uniref:uncharacterized protein n=1 Tax=Rhodotorula paludigena TaxID=86838 RepID=UPI003176FBAE
MSTHLYDLDGDGLYDTAYRDPHVDPYYGGSEYLDDYGYGGAYDYDGGYGDGYGYGGGYGHGYGGYGDEPLWGAYEGYMPDLYDYTSFIDHDVPLSEAWQDDSWSHDQYALADLMYFQRQLELDHALDESERLRRWEERLAWEQLNDEERALRYSELAAAGSLGMLGLAGGWWGRRYGGGSFDLSYLREVPLSRGLFGSPYRSAFTRHQGLARRYSPYFSRSRLRAFGGPTGLPLGGAGMPIAPRPGASYHSRRLSLQNGAGLSLREQELRSRLRVAEMRASLTGLSLAQRAQALEDARRLRAQLNAEFRLARDIDRSERRADAVLAAQEVEQERRELRDEMREQEGIARLEMAAGDLMGSPMPGSFGGGPGYRGGYY